jgi:hypothetical protein
MVIDAPLFHDRADLLHYAAKQVSVSGLWLEFGVASGNSLRLLAGYTPKIYGFDSFKGLPEPWAGFKAGHFATANIPAFAKNVELIIGVFEETLPTFFAANSGPCAFVNIDCDLYSSTQTVLKHICPRIIPGTILFFDEIHGTHPCLEHEAKAWSDYAPQFKTEWFGKCKQYQAACRITEISCSL